MSEARQQAGIAVAILIILSGCGHHVVIAPSQPPSTSPQRIPISVRIELQSVTTLHPWKGVGFTIDEPSLKQALAVYAKSRETFQEVVDGPADYSLNINAKYSMEHPDYAHYQVILEGVLTDGKGNRFGPFKGNGFVRGDKTRFSYESDRWPTQQAVGQAAEFMFQEIDRNYQVIVAKIERPPASVAMLSSTSSVEQYGEVERVPAGKVTMKKNSYAIVIGIEQYREKLPKADFADRDAKLVGEYLTKVMGYSEENVIVRTNDKASMNDLAKYLESWLPNNVEKDSSVFIYYSGHGAPNTKTGDAYLVPYDGDPTFVEKTGYPLKKLYAQLENLPTKDITVVLDSCFSGAGGRSVIGKGLRPMGLSMERAISAAGKVVVLAASSGDQVSSTYEEKGHGLLTYFFLKGLQGEGDLNKDGNIDMAELYEYVKPSVSKVARKQYNNEQTPQLLAGPDVLKKGGGWLVERTN